MTASSTAPASAGTTLLQQVPLAARTSLGLGGPAEFLARVSDAAALPELIDWAARRGLPLMVLGGGTNVVVSDAGVSGLVLVPELRGETIEREGAEVEVSAGAGEPWDGFVQRCVERGWAGLECLSGIPGQLGATPIQNVGAYGQDVGAVLRSVDVFDLGSGARATLQHDECGFGYRTSRFKSRAEGHLLVLGARFALRAGGEPCLGYPEIARAFAAPGAPRPSLTAVRDVVLATRRGKSMLLDPADENGRSCGSFFLNPELTPAELDALASRAPEAPPSFRQADGRSKVPAAWLIEQAGFRRGQRFGCVGISSRHALALVCHAGATAAQLIEAAHRIRDRVHEAFGVTLSPEPRFFGFETPSDALPPL